MPPPNILWICTDQQRFDTLGCYGNPHVDTPNLDRLSASGVRFERCFAQSPICTPSRVSFLTGRYPRTTRCRQNGQRIPDDERILPRRLADEGYTCGLAGKLHLAPASPERDHDPMREDRIDDGFADFHWSHGPDPHWPTNEYQQWLREREVTWDPTPMRDHDHVAISVPAEYRQTTWCAQRAINFVELAATFDEPWLYAVNTFDPHPRYDVFDTPREHLERYLNQLDDVPLPEFEPGELAKKPSFHRYGHRNEPIAYPGLSDEDHRLIRAAYWAMIDLIDDQVGRLLDALERTGQREETLVVFYSDHGEPLGDNGIYKKGPLLYDTTTRVPLIVAGPGVQEGLETDALVELTDLAPTLATAAGVEKSPGTQGRSLWPLLTGEENPDVHRETVYGEFYDAGRRYSDDHVPWGTMVRTDRYKLVRWHHAGTGELYDIKSDPSETTNRWTDPEYREIRHDMTDRLTDRMAGTVDPLPVSSGTY